MHNVLQSTLAGSGCLNVKRVASGVFKTFVSSQNVANVLVVVGTTNLGSSCIFFHSSFAAAMDAFRKLPIEPEVEDDLTAVVGPSPVPNADFTSAPWRAHGAWFCAHNLQADSLGLCASQPVECC